MDSKEIHPKSLGSVLDTNSESSCDASPSKRKVCTKTDRICRVCGDKALAYNFSAITCESCKAFFRRNAIKTNTQKCLFQGNCLIDIRTRRFCPKCRLDKCYSVGMKREMILDDSERRARMQKVMDNRCKKQKTAKVSVSSQLLVIKEEADTNMLSDQAYCTNRVSKQLPSDQTESMLPDALDSIKYVQLPYDEAESVLLDAVDSMKYQQFPSFLEASVNKDPSMHHILTAEEYQKFEYLGSIYSTTLGKSVFEHDLSVNSYKTCNDLINNSEVAVRRLIQFIKMLDYFQLLTKDDQVAATKACAISSLLLRSAFFYNIERDAWMTSSGDVSASILKNSTGYNKLYVLHTDFCRSLKQILKVNMILFALVQAIFVFNPDGKGIKNKSAVSDIQDKYMIMLKHYLEWDSSYANAPNIFSKLMLLIGDVKKVTEAHNLILLQANPKDIEPLMLEVLNLM